MILTIWRHGEAEDGVNDRLRQLTDGGRDDVSFGCGQFHAACSAKGIPHPQRILHSPWVRTVQTAEIIAAAFSLATVAAKQALHPGSDVAAVDAAMCADGTQEHIVLVSHQPLVSALADHYVGEVGCVPFLTPGGLVTMSLNMVAPDCGSRVFWAFPPTYKEGI
jgi:phosphohistidine phosphatase